MRFLSYTVLALFVLSCWWVMHHGGKGAEAINAGPDRAIKLASGLRAYIVDDPQVTRP